MEPERGQSDVSGSSQIPWLRNPASVGSDYVMHTVHIRVQMYGMVLLLSLWNWFPTWLVPQGSFIIRQLCIFLQPEDIYKETISFMIQPN